MEEGFRHTRTGVPVISLIRAGSSVQSPGNLAAIGAGSGTTIGNIQFAATSQGGGGAGVEHPAAGIKCILDANFTTNDAKGAITFYTRPEYADGDVERMRISSLGNVGIGTTSPSTALHLRSTADAEPYITIEQAGANVNSGGITMANFDTQDNDILAVSYTHLRAHET